MKQNAQANLSPRSAALGKYNSARMNLLLVVGVTLINMILLFFGGGTYFLFSASIPYYLVLFGMLFCGKLPADWYGEDLDGFEFLDTSVLVTMTVIAAVILVLYLIFFFLSKNQKSGWLVAALVFFAIDTAALVWLDGFSIDSILDIILHALVLYYLIAGLVAAHKLKTLPPDDEEIEKDGIDYFAEKVTFENGKEAEKVGANYFFGKNSSDGVLYFYNDRMIFKPQGLNVYSGNVTFKYADMASTEPQKNLLVDNGLLVHTKDGIAHRFVIQHRDDVKYFIDRKILSFAEQA